MSKNLVGQTTGKENINQEMVLFNLIYNIAWNARTDREFFFLGRDVWANYSNQESSSRFEEQIRLLALEKTPKGVCNIHLKGEMSDLGDLFLDVEDVVSNADIGKKITEGYSVVTL